MDSRGGGSRQTRGSARSILPANVEAFSKAPRPIGEDDRGGRRTLSAKRVIALLAVGLAAVAVFVPLPLHRPAWIEAEVVLGVWWALWAGVLTSMLYAGVGLLDDLVVSPGTTADGGDRWWDHLGAFDWAGVDAEGCLIGLILLVLLGVFILLGVLLTEVVLPLLAPLAYAVLLWMLTRVLHHHPACQRNLVRALGLGVWWASVYTAPLAFAVLLMHIVF